jgi:hypothetical protein
MQRHKTHVEMAAVLTEPFSCCLQISECQKKDI